MSCGNKIVSNCFKKIVTNCFNIKEEHRKFADLLVSVKLKQQLN